MTIVHSTAVVIIPPKEIWGAIQDIRKKYDKHIHRWMPHITLFYLKTLRSNWSPLKFKILSIYFIAREKTKLSEFKSKKEIF